VERELAVQRQFLQLAPSKALELQAPPQLSRACRADRQVSIQSGVLQQEVEMRRQRRQEDVELFQTLHRMKAGGLKVTEMAKEPGLNRHISGMPTSRRSGFVNAAPFTGDLCAPRGHISRKLAVVLANPAGCFGAVPSRRLRVSRPNDSRRLQAGIDFSFPCCRPFSKIRIQCWRRSISR
jgi:hypothetical protein